MPHPDFRILGANTERQGKREPTDGREEGQASSLGADKAYWLALPLPLPLKAPQLWLPFRLPLPMP